MQYKKFSELPLEASPDGGMYAPIVDPTEPSVDDQNKRVLLSSLWSSAPFTQSGAGAVTRTVDSKLKDVVSVKDFGAVGDNVTDDSPAIQAALNWLATAPIPVASAYNRGALALYVPAGSYRCQSPLTLAARSNITIYGDGGSSVIYGAVHQGATLTFGSTETQTVNATIRDITFSGHSSGTVQTDTALKIVRHYGLTLDNVRCVEAHTGLLVQGLIHGFIRGCQFRRNTVTTANTGINIRLEVAQSIDLTYRGISGVHIQDCELMGSDSIDIDCNIYVRHCDGLYIDNCHIYKARYDLQFDPDGVGNNGITSVFVSNTYFDSAGTNNVRLSGTVLDSGTSDVTSKLYKELSFSNCFFRDTSVCVQNVVSASTDHYPQSVKFDGCIFKQATNGINSPSTSALMDFSVSDSVFERMSGAAIFNNNVGNVSITNNQFSDQKNLATPATALSLTTTGNSRLQISDNQFQETYSNESPVTLANYLGKVSVYDSDSNASKITTAERCFSKSCTGGGATTTVGSFLLVDKMSGVCEYTIYGSDDSDSNSGYHAKTGYFGFRNNAGTVTLDSAAVNLNQTHGTLGTNTATPSVATNQFRISVVNNDTNSATYTVRYRIILGSVGVS